MRRAKPIDPLEAAIQLDVIDLYERVGCVVARMPQSYRRGSRRNPGTPGLPDLYVFPPLRKTDRGYINFAASRCPFFHETKTPTGKQSEAQREWQLLCTYRAVGYVLGGTEAALVHLRAIGLIAA